MLVGQLRELKKKSSTTPDQKSIGQRTIRKYCSAPIRAV